MHYTARDENHPAIGGFQPFWGQNIDPHNSSRSVEKILEWQQGVRGVGGSATACFMSRCGQKKKKKKRVYVGYIIHEIMCQEMAQNASQSMYDPRASGGLGGPQTPCLIG